MAQTMWRQHRALVGGLVLCSTSTGPGTMLERAGLLGLLPLAAGVRLLPPIFRPRGEVVTEMLLGPVHGHGLGPWAWDEMRRTGLDTVALAGQAVGAFDSRPWVHAIDVPTAVVVTERDHVVPPRHQEELARAIPGATLHPIDAGHGACLTGADRFVPALLEACHSVADRAPAHRAADVPAPSAVSPPTPQVVHGH